MSHPWFHFLSFWPATNAGCAVCVPRVFRLSHRAGDASRLTLITTWLLIACLCGQFGGSGQLADIIRRKLDGSTVNLSYDADGLLRQKTVFNAGLTLVSATGYLQDAMNPTGYAQIMEERINASTGTTVKTYAYGSDLISQAVLPPSTSTWTLNYFQYDGLGSVRELTNASGTITDTWDYDAFGVLVSSQTLDPGTQTLISQPLSSATLRNAYLYRGERFEADIGQYYLRARFYNQNTGRFWNQDSYEGSASDPMSLHKYLYANSSPLMFSDPSGNFGLQEMALAFFAMATVNAMAVPELPRAKSRKEGVLFVRLNKRDEPRDSLLMDGNSGVWRRLIQNYSLELYGRREIQSSNQLQFMAAHWESEAVEIMDKAYKHDFEVVLSSHGNTGDNERKAMFGRYPYPKAEFYAKMNEALGVEFLSDRTKWYSCDWDNGARTPEEIFDNEAKHDIRDKLWKINHE